MKNKASLTPSPGNEQVIILVTFCFVAIAPADKKKQSTPAKNTIYFLIEIPFHIMKKPLAVGDFLKLLTTFCIANLNKVRIAFP